MMLADLGADVVRIDRPGEDLSATHSVLLRGRRSVVLELKDPNAVRALLALADRSHVVLEGFRPGVAERLGFGPEVVLGRNPRVVYGRMTGWGQSGPYAGRAGHDITYLAVTGALEAFVGHDGTPTAPLNLLGDFGGGGMLLALGVVSALVHARAMGTGQVVDAAIVDGIGLMMGMHQSMRASGLWDAPRGENLFDGGAPFYRCYRTRDGRWVAVGAIEPVFYQRLLAGLDLTEDDLGGGQMDRPAWPRMRGVLADRFAERTRDEWTRVFADLDACVAPVLSVAEAEEDPHLAARPVYGRLTAGEGDDRVPVHPAPAPRLSATPGRVAWPAPAVGEHTAEVLGEVGLSAADIQALGRSAG
jgi:alpha-methylacyl-CoA racemase